MSSSTSNLNPICLLRMASSRPIVVVLSALFASLFSSQVAEAGVTTSLDSSAAAYSDLDETHHPDCPIDSPSHQLLTNGRGLYGIPQSTSTSSTSTPTSAGAGPQVMATFSTALLSDSPRIGWVTPESALALPPLLPSGLFRPPCA